MKRKTLLPAIVALFTGIALGLFLAVRLDLFTHAASQNVSSEAVQSAPAGGDRIEDAVTRVAATTGKAVVSISAEHTVSKGKGEKRYYFGSPGGSPFGEDEFFRRFFDDFFGSMPQRDYKQIGLGSGVIIDPEGYILTNEHVVGDADKIKVTLPDGREFKGELKGRDARSDTAVIKINAHNLPVASLGNSDNLKIGQWVVAIGNPFGFALQNPEPTVTAGVVSALHRSLGRISFRNRDYSDLIQTDAAINPGNSGGPLVNLKGEVVGINVAIFTTSGGYQGVGFAIPINSSKRVIASLIAGKKILYGWLGVTVQDLNEDLSKHFGLPDKNGALVAGVVEKGPAQKAGIKAGDVIKWFDNKPINSVKELLSVVGRSEVGRKIKIVLARDGKQISLEVAIGERPPDAETLPPEADPSGNWRGLSVDDLSSENARRFQAEEKKGVLVIEIEPGSPADEAGLSAGDVIVEINKQPVKSVSDYEKITKGLKGDALVRTTRGYSLIKGAK